MNPIVLILRRLQLHEHAWLQGSSLAHEIGMSVISL